MKIFVLFFIQDDKLFAVRIIVTFGGDEKLYFPGTVEYIAIENKKDIYRFFSFIDFANNYPSAAKKINSVHWESLAHKKMGCKITQN